MPRRSRKKSSIAIPRPLIIITILSGIITLILRIAGRKLQLPELSEVAGYTGTAFIIGLIIIIAIFLLKQGKK